MSDIKVNISGPKPLTAKVGGSSVSVGIGGTPNTSVHVGGSDVLQVQTPPERTIQTKLRPDCCGDIDGGMY